MMTTTLKLSQSMSTCPTVWQNFFYAECEDGLRDVYGDVRPSFINRRLKKYRAKLVNNDWDIEFDTEQDLTLFLLKWS